MARAIPFCRAPFAPDQSIAMKWQNLLFTFAPELVPIFQALRHVAFETAFDRFVIALGLHFIGPVIVTGKSILGIVIVAVARSVADILHQLCRRIENILRRHQAARFFRRPV